MAFVGGQLAPGAGRLQKPEPGEREAADAPAKEAEGGVAYGGGHATHLTVFAFVEDEREPGVGHVFAETHGRIARRERGGLGVGEVADFERSAGVVGQSHAGGEAGEGVVNGNTFHENPVFAFVGVARIEKLRIEAGFVGKQQKAFAVGVEPAEGINARRQARGEAAEGSPGRARLGSELREDSVGLVKGEEHGFRVARRGFASLVSDCIYARNPTHRRQPARSP